jgi:hypothetical protein
MTKILNWIFYSPGHFLTAYAIGAVIFVSAMTLYWGFVHRPTVRGENTSARIWTSEEVVEFAMMQGILWPLATATYLISIVLFSSR